MKDNPLVTVFIAAYNCEKFIEETIKSILGQTYKNLEIVIVDDGSKDNTIEKISGFKDSRIRLYENIENKGIPYTRNQGLKYAKGKYIAIIDADDIANENRIEKQIEFMENNPNVDVLSSYYKTLGNKFPRVIKSKFINPEEIKCYLMFYNNISNPTVMIKRKIIKKYNLIYDEEYFVAQDYKLWSEIIKYGEIQILPECLMNYRVGHKNITKLSKTEKGKSKQRKYLIDNIHKDLIKYYGFKLSVKEKELFNNLFTDNVIDYYDIKIGELNKLIKKLVAQNKEKFIFDEAIFIEVLNDCIFNSIKKHKNGLIKSLKIMYNVSIQLKVKNYRKYILLVTNTIKDLIRKT